MLRREQIDDDDADVLSARQEGMSKDDDDGDDYGNVVLDCCTAKRHR